MFYLKIILLTSIAHLLLELDASSQDGVVITFNINLPTTQMQPTCDHGPENMNNYTVQEGENFTIITKYGSLINQAKCYEKYNPSNVFKYEFMKFSRNVTTYKAVKEMGTVWECQFLSLFNNSYVIDKVVTSDGTYANTLCTMNIHVRRNEAPQRILVNNVMEMDLTPTPLSEKEVDLTADYLYEVGDRVHIICVPRIYKMKDNLSIQYPYAEKLTNTFSVSSLKSARRLGISTTLTSLHDGTYFLCTYKNNSDYTTVRLRFVIRQTNFINITINGLTVRPQLKDSARHFYIVDYKYDNNKNINVTCETTPDMKNVMVLMYDKDLIHIDNSQEEKLRQELIFSLEPSQTTSFRCAVDYVGSPYGVADNTEINFSPGDTLINHNKIYMVMEIPETGTVLELFSEKLQIIYYEYKADEDLEIKCSIINQPVYVSYMHFKDDEKINYHQITKTVKLSSESQNSTVTCYLREMADGGYNLAIDSIKYEIRLIFVKNYLILETEAPPTVGNRVSTDAETEGDSTVGPDVTYSTPYEVIGAIAAVVLLILTSICLIFVKLRKRNQDQGDPQAQNYENLATPSEGSIPPYPPQWEANNYAVPIDHRPEEPAYSVPIQPLYTDPVPKSLRKPKQNQVSPTYAILNLKAKAKRNVLKETNDPNYSEVYASPGNYANVIKDSPYVNAEEPMYSEANVATKNQYSNINNLPYANSSRQEYVEPTYCEPQTKFVNRNRNLKK